MSVQYKFASCATLEHVACDGLGISVSDLKKAIQQQKRIGKSADFDLQIVDANSSKGKPPDLQLSLQLD